MHTNKINIFFEKLLQSRMCGTVGLRLPKKTRTYNSVFFCCNLKDPNPLFVLSFIHSLLDKKAIFIPALIYN